MERRKNVKVQRLKVQRDNIEIIMTISFYFIRFDPAANVKGPVNHTVCKFMKCIALAIKVAGVYANDLVS